MSVCIVWKKARSGFVIVGLINLVIFIILLISYFVLAKLFISVLSGFELVVALAGCGLGMVFVGTYVFHVAVDAFRRIKRFDKETSRGLEICV